MDADLTDFGRTHFGEADLGDKRRTDRLVVVADRIASHPLGGKNQFGYLCHNSVAVGADGEPLGLANQILHKRRRRKKKTSSRAKRNARMIPCVRRACGSGAARPSATSPASRIRSSI